MILLLSKEQKIHRTLSLWGESYKEQKFQGPTRLSFLGAIGPKVKRPQTIMAN